MRKAIAMAGIALAVWSALNAFAQRRPPTEAEALAYIYSAFLTQADPGVMGPHVVLGPELQRTFALPSNADGAKVYGALIALSGQKQVEVRRATLQEVVEYGARRGFDRNSGPLYTLDIGEQRFLVQYALQRISISFVGQLGVPDPDPRPMAIKVELGPAKGESAPSAGFATVAMRDSRPQPGPLNLQWTAQFEFNSAALTAEARAALDSEILPKLQAAEIRYLHVSGHADRVGPAEYNQRLSEKRAEAVRAYLVAKGLDESKIGVFTYGKTLPVKSCRAEQGAALIECLAPNRRVVLEVRAP